MTELTTILVCIGYLSLAIELLFFPVPSVASTYQLVNNETRSSNQTETKGKIGQIKQQNSIYKFVVLVVPAAINILVFLLPLVILFVPGSSEYLQLIYQQTVIASMVGLGLIGLGRFITFSSVLQIRKNNQQKAENFSLKVKGWFSKSRNPGLVGMYIFGLGLIILFPSIFMIAGFVFYLGFMHFKVLLEEDFLYQYYGSKYMNYKTKTARYLLPRRTH